MEITAKHPWEIEWSVGDAEIGDGGLSGGLVTGGRAGGDDETGTGILVLPFADQFQGDDGFSDTDRVDMNCSVGFELWGFEIQADAFVELGAEAIAAEHFHDPTGKGDEEQYRKDGSVDEEGEESFHAGQKIGTADGHR